MNVTGIEGCYNGRRTWLCATTDNWMDVYILLRSSEERKSGSTTGVWHATMEDKSKILLPSMGKVEALRDELNEKMREFRELALAFL